MNDKKRKVVAFLATYPGRLRESEIAINSLIDQVDHIYVYLNLYEEIPEFLARPNITCILGRFAPEGDLRDLGKFHFLDVLDDEIALLVDDDIRYPENYASKMIDSLEKYDSQVIIGVHGRILEPNFNDYFVDSRLLHFRRRLMKDMIVDVLGTGTVAFDSRKIKFRSESFNRRGKADIDFAIAARNMNIPLITVSHEKSWLRDTNLDEDSGPNLYLEFKSEGIQHARILSDSANWNPGAMRKVLNRVSKDKFPVSILDQLRAIYHLDSQANSVRCSCRIPVNVRASRLIRPSKMRTQMVLLKENDPELREILDLVSGIKDFGPMSFGQLENAVVSDFLSKNPVDGTAIWVHSKSKTRCTNCSISLARLIFQHDAVSVEPIDYLAHCLATMKSTDRYLPINKFFTGALLLINRIVDSALSALFSGVLLGKPGFVRLPFLILKRTNNAVRHRALGDSFTRLRLIRLASELLEDADDVKPTWKLLAESNKLSLSDKIELGHLLEYGEINIQILTELLMLLSLRNKPLKLITRLKFESLVTAIIDTANQNSVESLDRVGDLLLRRAQAKKIRSNAPYESLFYLWALKRMGLQNMEIFSPQLNVKPETLLMFQCKNSYSSELNSVWIKQGFSAVLESDNSLDHWGSKNAPLEEALHPNSFDSAHNLKMQTTESGPLLVACMAMCNSASTLREAIKSIQNQTFENWELWCVDDVSDDSSLEIAQEFASRDNRIKVVALDKKLGPYLIRNLVLEKSKSKFLAITDSDDWSHPQRFEKQIEILSDESKLVSFTKHIRLRARVFQTENNGQYFGDGLSSAMYNRNIFKTIGVFLGTKTRGDLEYLYRIDRVLNNQVIARINSPLLIARHGFSSNSHQFSETDLNEFKERWAKFHSKLSKQLETGQPIENLDRVTLDLVPKGLQI